MIERTTGIKVCNEVIVRKSIMLDHLPTNFDVAFRRARERLMMEGRQRRPSLGVLDETTTEGKQDVKLDDRVKNVHIHDNELSAPETEPNHHDSSSVAANLDQDEDDDDISHPIWDKVAKLGLKNTTKPTGVLEDNKIN